MTNHDSVKLLHGPYHTPRFKLGDVVIDEARGLEVVIVGIREARIPWPVGKPKGVRAKAPIVFDDLQRALRVESGFAICHHWGITPQTVTKWRKALGNGSVTEGTHRLKSINANSPGVTAGLAKAHERSRDAEADTDRRQKIAAAKIGKPRKWSTIKKLIRATTGKKASTATRAKLSATAKTKNNFARLGLPPAWTAEEDAVLGNLPPRKAAIALKRPLAAVYSRRYRLKIGDGKQAVGTSG